MSAKSSGVVTLVLTDFDHIFGVALLPPDDAPGELDEPDDPGVVDDEPGAPVLGELELAPGAGGFGVVIEPDAAPLASNFANSPASRLPSLLRSSVFHCLVSSLLLDASRLLSLPFLSVSMDVRSALAPTLAPALPLALGLELEPVLGLVVDGVLVESFGLLDEEPDELGGGATCATADAVKPAAAAETVAIARSRCSELRFILPPKSLNDRVLRDCVPSLNHHDV